MERIIGKPGIEVRVGDEGRIRRHEKRVAVRGSFGDRFSSDLTRAARLVLDNELLAPFFGEPLRQRTRNNVRDAAGREWHNDVHGFGWIGLRARDAAG